MLTTIKGYYDHGQIILEEAAPVDTKTDVMVTFLPSGPEDNARPKRKLGGLEGLVNLPDDFNEPLDDFKDYM